MSLQFIRVDEHPVQGYRSRTEFNANNATLTFAFYVDGETAGERLTRKLAGPRFVPFDMKTLSPAEAKKRVSQAVFEFKSDVINIAGNGIYTFSNHGWTQEAVNEYIIEALGGIPLVKVKGMRSGGQTGADIAGAVAGEVLGIKTIVTLPKGYVQRFEDGKDIEHTKEEIEAQIESWVESRRSTLITATTSS
jgi:hypothetical protein